MSKQPIVLWRRHVIHTGNAWQRAGINTSQALRARLRLDGWQCAELRGWQTPKKDLAWTY